MFPPVWLPNRKLQFGSRPSGRPIGNSDSPPARLAARSETPVQLPHVWLPDRKLQFSSPTSGRWSGDSDWAAGGPASLHAEGFSHCGARNCLSWLPGRSQEKWSALTAVLSMNWIRAGGVFRAKEAKGAKSAKGNGRLLRVLRTLRPLRANSGSSPCGGLPAVRGCPCQAKFKSCHGRIAPYSKAILKRHPLMPVRHRPDSVWPYLC